MKARLLREGKEPALGEAHQFNTHAMFEVIFCFQNAQGEFDDQDSVFGKDVEVFVEAKKAWMPLGEALKTHDVINDNYNTRFFEPQTPADRERGFTL